MREGNDRWARKVMLEALKSAAYLAVRIGKVWIPVSFLSFQSGVLEDMDGRRDSGKGPWLC